MKMVFGKKKDDKIKYTIIINSDWSGSVIGFYEDIYGNDKFVGAFNSVNEAKKQISIMYSDSMDSSDMDFD